MAKAPWVNVSPASGSGDKEVPVSSFAEHTGRLVRSTVVTFKAANCDDVPRTVNQAGKPEYTDIDDTASADKEGKVVTIAGISNSARLTFTLGTGDLAITLPDTYKASSVDVANGEAIPGDPGAQAAYNFAIVLTVPANEQTEPQSRQIIATDEGGHQDVCTLTLAAGDAYLTVTEGTIELDYQGTPVTIQVKSNTSCTAE